MSKKRKGIMKSLKKKGLAALAAGHGDVNYPLLMGSKLKLDVGEDSYTIQWSE